MNTTLSMQSTPTRSSRLFTVILWTVQILLALLFLFSGSMKFLMPIELMTQQTPFLPALFFYFIGVAEILGALGLVFPAALRIQPALTPLAALGLLIIMIGATTLTLLGGLGIAAALYPGIVGLLCAYVAYARRRSLLP